MGSTNHAFDGGQSQGNTPYLLMICSLTGAHAGARRRAWTSNFEHDAVSQEGGFQLNHLYGDITHPWGVPTQHKINPEACILPRPCARAVSLASRYTATAVYSRDYSFFVLYTGIQRTRIVPRRLQRSTALQRYTAVYSLQLYSGLQSTAVYNPPL